MPDHPIEAATASRALRPGRPPLGWAGRQIAAGALRVRAALPRGRTLPADHWDRRHAWMVSVLWSQAMVLLVWGLASGPLEAAFVVAPLGAFALAATVGRRRLPREVAVVTGLLLSSAVVVHLMHGRTEGHFHFFVVVSLLSLYEAWFPYLLAFAFVLLHHGVVGMLAPGVVFHDHDQVADPWRWAVVHALFIGALAAVHLSAWKLNEDTRARTAEGEERFRSAFEHAPTGMALVDLDGVVLRANAALAAIAGVPAARIVGRPLRLLVGEAPDGWPSPADGVEEGELRFRTGGLRWGLWHHSCMRDGDGAPVATVSHCIDVTPRRQAEADLVWQAEHDALTGLPNRRLLSRRLRASLAAGEPIALIVIDVDDLNVVNDSLGYRAGDAILIAVSRRLAEILREADVLARLGGDDFGLLMHGATSPADVMAVAERIEEALLSPVEIDGQRVYVTASLGIRMPHDGDAEPGPILRDADAALHRAVSAGKGGIAVFEDAMHRSLSDRLEIERGLRTALVDGELHLAFQPVVSIADGRVTGVEALVRWTHPERGEIPPDRFIPLAEQNGTILPIGKWVLHEACRTFASWGRDDLAVSVNVSARQLVSMLLVEEVAAALAGSGLAPERLCLEVTETAVLSDPTATARTLAGLKALGVRIAVDDFGVGTGSLHQLRTLLPVDMLKIDRSFVRGIADDAHDAGIVEGVIGLAHSLGLAVVAEGVETGAHARLLREWGCEMGQGYLFARPMSDSRVREWLAARANAVPVA